MKKLILVLLIAVSVIALGCSQGDLAGQVTEAAKTKFHSADVDRNMRISNEELNYVVQLREAGTYHCDTAAYSGFAGGAGNQRCAKHSADFNKNWVIDVVPEVVRVAAFKGAGGYKVDRGTADGFAPDVKPKHFADTQTDVVGDATPNNWRIELGEMTRMAFHGKLAIDIFLEGGNYVWDEATKKWIVAELGTPTSKFHPADLNQDGSLSLAETTLFVNQMLQAKDIWLKGEFYHWVSDNKWEVGE